MRHARRQAPDGGQLLLRHQVIALRPQGRGHAVEGVGEPGDFVALGGRGERLELELAGADPQRRRRKLLERSGHAAHEQRAEQQHQPAIDERQRDQQRARAAQRGGELVGGGELEAGGAAHPRRAAQRRVHEQ